MTVLAVSAVVCTYSDERWTRLRTAVDSLLAQRPASAETLVVVDHNPRLLERVRKQWPEVVAVENRNGKGLSGARNTAMVVARHPIVAFLDDDAEASSGWLARLGSRFTDPRVMGVGGAVTPVWATGRPAWFPPEFDWVVGCSYQGMPTSVEPVRNPLGSGMALRRELVATVGEYRSDLGRVGNQPFGCEETEFCIRVHRQRPETVFLFEPAAEVLHYVPADRATWTYFWRRCYSEGLSKAVVGRAARGSLAMERRYAGRTLPRALRRELARAVRGELSGLSRAGAIIAGLACTVAGFAKGNMTAIRAALPWEPGR